MSKVSHRDAYVKAHIPVHNKHPADSQLTLKKSVHRHFHCPYNEHNRFQSSATITDLSFLRDVQRFPPYKTQQDSPAGSSSAAVGDDPWSQHMMTAQKRRTALQHRRRAAVGCLHALVRKVL
jgi:hypothetical protein